MPVQRRLISAPELQALIERETRRGAPATNADETAHPIYVRSFNGRYDDKGCNWAVSFVQDRHVSRDIIAKISKLRAMYNIA